MLEQMVAIGKTAGQIKNTIQVVKQPPQPVDQLSISQFIR
jgi:hypothetical protein